MKSLQSELDSINSQLELLTYRKNQLDSIMGEYSEVINRVKSLVLSMEDAMIEPVNLLIEIEGLIHGQEFEAVEPEPTPEPTPKTESVNSKRYPNNIYWDNGSGVRVFISKKRRFKSELEAIASDCINQGYSTKFEVIECDGDWLVMFSQVLSEVSVQGIIDNFYPKHSDGETEPTPEPTPEPPLLEILQAQSETKPELTQLNSRAWRRENTLLIGFSNKRLLNVWCNWFKSSWSGQIHWAENNDKLDGFEHCLGILWYGSLPEVKRWERLTNLDYAVKPDEQQQQGIVKVV
jgi:hypothetical protein